MSLSLNSTIRTSAIAIAIIGMSLPIISLGADAPLYNELAYQSSPPPIDVFILDKPQRPRVFENSSPPEPKEVGRLPFMTQSEIKNLSPQAIEDLVTQGLFKQKHAHALLPQQIKSINIQTLQSLIPLLEIKQIPHIKGEQIAALSPLSLQKILGSITRYQMKFLRQPQIQAFSSKQLKRVFDHLEEDQVALIPPQLLNTLSKYKVAAKAHMLSTAQFQAISPQHLESIIDTGRLVKRQAALIKSSQLKALSPLSFVSLVPLLPEDRLVFASAEQLSTFLHQSPIALSKIKRFSAIALAGIAPVDFASLYINLSKQQLKDLYTQKLLSPFHMASLSEEQIQATPTVLLSKLSLEALEKTLPLVTKDQLKQLLAHNLGYLLSLDYFTEDRIRQLDPSVIRELHPDNLSDIIPHLTSDQLQYLSVHHIRGLAPENLQALSLSQLSALDKQQLSHLSSEQVQALRIDHIRSLDSNMIEVIVDKLGDQQLAFLLRHQLQAALDILPPEDLAHLSDESFESLPVSFLINLSASKQLSIFKNFSHIFTLEQFESLFPNVLASLGKSEIKLSQRVLQQLSPQHMVEVIPLLHASQITKLSEEALKEYLPIIEQYHLQDPNEDLLRQLPKSLWPHLSSNSLKWMQKEHLWTKEEVQALSFDQLQELKPTFITQHFSLFTYEQLLLLSPELIAQLPEDFLASVPQALEVFSLAQVQAFQSFHLDFIRRELSTLEEEKLMALLPKLKSAHLRSLSQDKLFGLLPELQPSQIASLDFSSFATLALQTIKTLSPEQVAAIPLNNLQEANFDQLSLLFDKLSVQQVKALAPSIKWKSSTFIPQLNAKHLQAMGASFINKLSPKELALLNPTELRKLPPKPLIDLKQQTLSYLKPFLSVSALKEAQLIRWKQQLPTLDVQQLTDQDLPNLFPYFNEAQYNSLSQKQWRALPAELLSLVPPKVIANFSQKWFSELSVAQLHALSPLQLQALSPSIFEGVSAFLIDLSPPQIKALPPQHLAKLSFNVFIEYLPHLQRHQLSAIPAEHLRRLSREDIQNLSIHQVSGLSQSQIESFSGLQISALSKEQMEAMNFFPTESTFLNLYSHDVHTSPASFEPSLIEKPHELPYPKDKKQLPQNFEGTKKAIKNPFGYKDIPLNLDPTSSSTSWGYGYGPSKRSK